MAIASPIVTCVRCTRAFRPHGAKFVVCPICMELFATTGKTADQDEKGPYVKTPPPPNASPKPVKGATAAPAPPVGEIVSYPTPRGICANLACKKAFEPYSNQPYCCFACRDVAVKARAAAREQARKTA